jgi:ABC-type oligopeptide transport system substrate-binding subunit
MKKSYFILISSCFLLLTTPSCVEDNLKTKTLNYSYEVNPENLNYLTNESTSNISLFSNCLEGLMENDKQGNIKGALASSWHVSEDGLTYTYKIRKNASWVNQNGQVKAKVKPSDWIASLKYAIKSKSENLYLINKSLKGLDKYLTKEDPDFSHVGIKADDKKGILTYTLNEPEVAWHSKTLHPILFPVNEKFLKAKGKKFGKVEVGGILYNGAFTMNKFKANSEIQLKANPHYHDKKNVHINKIQLSFLSAKNTEQKYTDFITGKTSACILQPSDKAYEKIKKRENQHILLDLPKSSTNFLTFNLNRSVFKYTNANKDISGTHKAILNSNFRKAFSYAIDKAAYNTQIAGKEAGLAEVRNSLIQPNFVMVGEKNYGLVLQEKLQALDPEWKKITVVKDGVNDSLQVESAKQYLEKARIELEAQGVTFPIHLDYLEEKDANFRIKRIETLKQTIEDTLGKDNIIIDIQKQPRDKVMVATFLGTTPETMDWDIWINGFNPDFLDPFSYLRIFDPRSGAYLHSLGLHQTANKSISSNEKQIAQTIEIDKYAQLLDDANTLKGNAQLPERFSLFSQAEAHLLNQRVLIPLRSDISSVMLRIKPFSWSYGLTGIMRLTSWQTPRFKWMKLQKKMVTKAQYQKAKQDFETRLKKASILDEAK